MSKISEGDKAPDFTLPATQTEAFKLSDSQNLPLVLFFYPKDDTSGCTQEAIEFTGLLDEFHNAGYKVAGMSPDPIKKHVKFQEKHELSTNLISDEDKSVLSQFGVWVEKSMYGRKYMGVERATLVIGTDLTVLRAWHKVKVPEHASAVLDAVREL